MRANYHVAVGLILSILFASGEALSQSQPPPGYPQPGTYAPSPGPPAYPYYQPPPPSGYPPPPTAYQQPTPGTYPGYGPPPILRYQEGAAVPAGYHVEERPRKGLVVAGSVVLGSTYFLSAAIGMASQNSDDRWLLVPVFGPFLDLGARGTGTCSNSATATCDALETVVRFYLALDGVVQGAGALLFISGFAFPKKEFVSDTYYGESGRGPRVAWWTVTPEVTSSRLGLTLSGSLF